MTKQSCFLVTGASGFLGTNVADLAHERGARVIGVDIASPARRDIFSKFAVQRCERTDFGALVGPDKLDAVFHLAGGASVAQSMSDPIADFDSHLPGTVALLNFLGRHQPNTHLVFFSSAAVYGNPSTLPVSENEAIKPISPYGIHKATTEFAITHYARLFKLRFSVLRLFSAYGEGLRKQVVWDIGRKVLAARNSGERAIKLRGTGEESRDFIYASDIARAALLVAAKAPASDGQILNVASGEETTVAALAKLIVSVSGAKVDVQFDGARAPGDPVNWRADVTRLTKLGFSQEMTLVDGVTRTIRWQETLSDQPSTLAR